jgi:hypothetical protein
MPTEVIERLSATVAPGEATFEERVSATCAPTGELMARSRASNGTVLRTNTDDMCMRKSVKAIAFNQALIEVRCSPVPIATGRRPLSCFRHCPLSPVHKEPSNRFSSRRQGMGTAADFDSGIGGMPPRCNLRAKRNELFLVGHRVGIVRDPYKSTGTYVMRRQECVNFTIRAYSMEYANGGRNLAMVRSGIKLNSEKLLEITVERPM